MQIKYAFIDYSQTIDDVYENLEDYEKKSVWWYDSRYWKFEFYITKNNIKAQRSFMDFVKQ